LFFFFKLGVYLMDVGLLDSDGGRKLHWKQLIFDSSLIAERYGQAAQGSRGAACPGVLEMMDITASGL